MKKPDFTPYAPDKYALVVPDREVKIYFGAWSSEETEYAIVADCTYINQLLIELTKEHNK